MQRNTLDSFKESNESKSLWSIHKSEDSSWYIFKNTERKTMSASSFHKVSFTMKVICTLLAHKNLKYFILLPIKIYHRQSLRQHTFISYSYRDWENQDQSAEWFDSWCPIDSCLLLVPWSATLSSSSDTNLIMRIVSLSIILNIIASPKLHLQILSFWGWS